MIKLIFNFISKLAFKLSSSINTEHFDKYISLIFPLKFTTSPFLISSIFFGNDILSITLSASIISIEDILICFKEFLQNSNPLNRYILLFSSLFFNSSVNLIEILPK